MDKLVAYHGKQDEKDFYTRRMMQHMIDDQIIHGRGWIPGQQKGCAVGCTLNDYDHRKYETELGVPMVVALIEDVLFEGMPLDASIEFPLALLEAIRPGADLSSFYAKYMLWLLTNETYGIRTYSKIGELGGVNQVIYLYERLSRGETIEKAEWNRAKMACTHGGSAFYLAYAMYYDDLDACSLVLKKLAKLIYDREWTSTTFKAEYALARDAGVPLMEIVEYLKSEHKFDALGLATDASDAFWLAARDEMLRLLSDAPMSEQFSEGEQE